MGLTTSLTHAISGLRVNQDSMGILSKNVANSGTPGYHRQSQTILDYNSESSSYARSTGVTRAFNKSLQTYYTRQVADASKSDVEAGYLDRLQGFLGKPGSAGSMDTIFGNLQNALQGLSTSPDDYTARSQVVAKAQNMAETLNRLSTTIQGMRQETEGQIAANVHGLNGMLNSLAEVNNRMLDMGMDDGSRASLLDQRDRLVSSVAEMIDVRADYRGDGTVALMTRSGVGLLDSGVSTFSFESAGNLAATSQFNIDPNLTKVGKLTLTTPSGLILDLVSQGVIQGGELGGLLTLRDRTLVEAQEQLDEIAAGLAQGFSTVQTSGTAAISGAANGFDINIADMQKGNDFLLNYTINGVDTKVRVVSTTEALDYKDANGTRVIGIDMSASSTAVAAALQNKLPGLAITSPAANSIRILDDGAGNTIDVKSATTRTTSKGLQGAGLAMSLFVDAGNAAFTNNLDGNPPQKLGFASRISVNALILADNRLLVQDKVGGTLGDNKRPEYVIQQLKNLKFVSGGNPISANGRFQLSGNLDEVISQAITFQGSTIAASITQRDDRQLTLDTVVQQMDGEYGVNTDEEMARLMELQNAYTANSRIIGVVKELLDALLNAV